ncbi:hypothetical protein RB614_19750 [Phytohabitans sp. ZYX-F-186]|uniref:Uncharacterized protein n=1 Tax=Phytohabitans maris TaxID=3071409 RepID=A0ABU0ZI73_9ACTN|nr:hypothetical protein [Phytohabitans sp. ZYX-F-186]MDQ7906754.1 hypothetical protein [Phytohabitans sp. ZYX-F-186]
MNTGSWWSRLRHALIPRWRRRAVDLRERLSWWQWWEAGRPVSDRATPLVHIRCDVCGVVTATIVDRGEWLRVRVGDREYPMLRNSVRCTKHGWLDIGWAVVEPAAAHARISGTVATLRAKPGVS